MWKITEPKPKKETPIDYLVGEYSCGEHEAGECLQGRPIRNFTRQRRYTGIDIGQTPPKTAIAIITGLTEQGIPIVEWNTKAEAERRLVANTADWWTIENLDDVAI
jgi:hypothetical protein